MGLTFPHETTWPRDAGAFRTNDDDSHPKKQVSYDSEMCHTKPFPNQFGYQIHEHLFIQRPTPKPCFWEAKYLSTRSTCMDIMYWAERRLHLVQYFASQSPVYSTLSSSRHNKSWPSTEPRLTGEKKQEPSSNLVELYWADFYLFYLFYSI